MIKSTLVVLFILLFSITLKSQVVKTDPVYPSDGVEITVIYNTYACDEVFKDFTGDIYAHTGVMTDKSVNSDDWKYVKTNWTENTSENRLTKINDSIYHLTITTSISSYYGVPSTEEVKQLAFVFRNSDGSKQTSNIYLDIFQPGLNIKFIGYDKKIIFERDHTEPVQVKVYPISTSDADSIFLYLDDSLIATNTGNDLIYNLYVTGNIDQTLIAKAKNASFTVFDTLSFFIKKPTTLENLPANTEIGINYIDESTATLVLYAPFKKFVYLIGDFTDWEISNDYLMNMTPDSTKYWITLTGLTAEKEYIYQYLIDGNLRVADPYTEKTCNPADSDIPEYIYPDPLSYPTGKTTEIASVLQTDQENYTWEVTSFSPPEKDNLVIYELLIRDFSSKRDIQTVLDSLDYIEQLGINAIELMPFNEFEGNESWGYNPSFYFAVDKAYGTKNDLKNFIDECHKRGLAVIMDIVLNHSYGQSPLVKIYFNEGTGECGASGISSNNPWYNQVCPSDYCWGYDFNHESEATQYFVDRVTEFWLEEYNIDGYRFDFTKGFTNKVGEGTNYDASRVALLKRIYDNLSSVKPEAYLILEHWAASSEEIELSDYGFMLWGNVTAKYQEAVMGYYSSDKSDFSAISYKNRSWNNPYLVGYMESHDEERIMYKTITWGNLNDTYDAKEINTGLRRDEAAAAFFFTIPGPKMVWMFGELGYDYSINTCTDGTIDESCRVSPKPVKWDYLSVKERKRLYQAYSALIKLRTQHEAFSSSDYSLKVRNALKSIHINHAEMDVTIIGNFDIVDGDIDPEFQQTGTWYDYMTGNEINVTDKNQNINLKPGEYRIYTTQKLEKPSLIELPTNLREVRNDMENHFLVYPNPSSGFFSFNISSDDFNNYQFSLYDIQGKFISNIKLDKTNSSENIYTWNAPFLNKGIYMLSIKSKSERIVKKITIF